MCHCDSGFEIKQSNSNSSSIQICEDVDECEKFSDICGSNARCLNHYGSYSCECVSSGFRPKYDEENTFKCEDIDECSSECLNECDDDTSLCTNRIGSYECVCKLGFTSTDDPRKCADINECSSNLYECDENAACVNTHGDFECQCKTGFYGNGTFCEG